MASQRPMTVRESVTLALENNKDIAVTRQNVRIAEFDLRAARGFFSPVLRYHEVRRYDRPEPEHITTNQKNRNSAVVGNATLTGYLPSFGTKISGDITNQNVSTNNPITVLSPQYNASLGFTIVQPLFRGRGFDQGRRAIEIAKRNLSLTDAQFRQRTIEIITNVQRAYWDLTFALRNLQVQRDAVRDAKQQMEHNRRLVLEGQLARSTSSRPRPRSRILNRRSMKRSIPFRRRRTRSRTWSRQIATTRSGTSRSRRSTRSNYKFRTLRSTTQ
jgi:HAE1 family hydrophobic/amphiphilic exporter-1